MELHSENPLLTCGTPASLAAVPAWLQTEIMRRCFWACFITQCINADHSSSSFFDERIMNSYLPIGERSFADNVQEPLPPTLTDVIKDSSIQQRDSSSSPSVMAELVTMILYWQVILVLRL